MWKVPNPQQLFPPIRLALHDLSKYMEGKLGEFATRMDILDGKDPWIPVVFTNGWVNYGGGWEEAEYRRVGQHLVQMKGLVTAGTHGAAIFFLPVGFRPVENLLFANINGNALGRLNVMPSGQVHSEAAIGNNSFVNLDCIFSTV
jgi:hypothetical protein